MNDDDYKFGFKSDVKPVFKSGKGLSDKLVDEISDFKNEPQWLRNFRHNALDLFFSMPMPSFGVDLSFLNFDDFHFYVKPSDRPKHSWDDVPKDIKDTFDKLGIPESEREFLAGTGAQFESDVVYHNLEKQLADKGVIFISIEEGIKDFPDLFQKYFASVVPPSDNKFAALNSAVFSGGSFIYVPKGVDVGLPLQAYFRMNSENLGQMERTLIIADEGAKLHYVEGCSAPIYSSDSLHAAVVELIVLEKAHVQYSTVQNWSSNVLNLVTKRAKVFKDASMFWLDCNIGSKVNMKYPSCVLMEEGAHGELQSVALAKKGQWQDAGGKMIHLASNTSSVVNSRSISKDGGRASYRGLVKVKSGVKDVKVKVNCDALLIDDVSRSDTYPVMDVNSSDVVVEHEATVSKIGEEQLFYLMSRGFSEESATKMIVNGFIEPIVKKLPMEYAVELNRLMEIEMDNSIS